MGAVGFRLQIIYAVIIVNTLLTEINAIGLHPRESETREVKKLDGIWNFIKSENGNPNQGIEEQWYHHDLSYVKPTIQMPVPSSYNDITQDITLRDHVGTVWYDRTFFVPSSWKNSDRKVFIRFESVNYAAKVWINGDFIISHEFGHLPFEGEITNSISYGTDNRVTVLCDNVLQETTIPQGVLENESFDNGTRIKQTYRFDFLNYAGIHRSVYLYTVPVESIEDVIIKTDVNGLDGIVSYDVKLNTNMIANKFLILELQDKTGLLAARLTTTQGVLNGTLPPIRNVKLWWPYLMNPEYGYLYTMIIILADPTQKLDYYRLKIGIRTLHWDSNQFLINNKPVYFHGLSKHEDSDIRGKGADNVLLVRDFNLLKWIGANTFRTSHYPYSTETMDMADEHGIMVIDECAGVRIELFSTELLRNHQRNIKELINRDKNHPSVIMWSIANEPLSATPDAEPYFRDVASFTKNEDPTRPITAALDTFLPADRLSQFLDIVSFNRYNSWYLNTGKLDMIVQRVIDDATLWHVTRNKPIMMLEYGADTIAGLHISPPVIWSEEFQSQMYAQHFRAFDYLRTQGFFIGEFVWNFADFNTAQTTTRVGGNKKGVFTRQRQPKSAAHLLRQRYFSLSNYLFKSEMPSDLFLYVMGGN